MNSLEDAFINIGMEEAKFLDDQIIVNKHQDDD